MGERKGTNKYYPPDFDPKKHGSLSGYTGSHPLRERARKLHMGILIIRFEMPYNIWCGGCNSHIGMGVRYNAEKSKIGNYYTTPIYKFRMKCHLCDNHFEIKTDPASHDYIIISGARRKEQRWDPKENEQIVPEDKSTQKKIALDAMYKLEHGVEDKTNISKAAPSIAQITRAQTLRKDDYMINKLARKKFREEKVALQVAAERDRALLTRTSLDIALVDEHEDDKRMAQLLKYRALQSYDEKQQEKRDEIQSRPIFPSPPPALPSTPSTSGSSSSESPASSASQMSSKLNEVRKKLGIAGKVRTKNPFDAAQGIRKSTANQFGIKANRKKSHTKSVNQSKDELFHSKDISREVDEDYRNKKISNNGKDEAASVEPVSSSKDEEKDSYSSKNQALDRVPFILEEDGTAIISSNTEHSKGNLISRTQKIDAVCDKNSSEGVPSCVRSGRVHASSCTSVISNDSLVTESKRTGLQPTALTALADYDSSSSGDD